MPDPRDLPTFAVGGSFMGTRTPPEDAVCQIVGIPLDIAASNRVGARFGPAAVRTASRMLVDGDNPSGWTSPLDLPFADIGDFRIKLGELQASLELIEAQAKGYDHLVAIGGDHSIALPLLRAVHARHGQVALIHFDAHIDTWEDSFGQVYGHGSPFRHALAGGIVDPKRMIQIGIRSPVQRAVWEWTTGQGVTIVPAEAVHMDGIESVVARIRTVVGQAPVYLSFDIDAIDPSQAPGTGTPEVGGLFTWQISAILKRLGGLNFVGMDLVEVAPAYDVAEITALAGATAIWQYLSLLAQRR